MPTVIVNDDVTAKRKYGQVRYAEYPVQRRSCEPGNGRAEQTLMGVCLDDMATVYAGNSRLETELFGHVPRAGVHATRAQANCNALSEQLDNRFPIARMNLPMRVEQRSVEVRN
jgi:hypothetical protein